MKTTLCFDFGNTRLKCAVFNNKEIVKVITLEDDSVASIEKIITEEKPRKSILSSVINHNPEIEALLEEKTKFHKLSEKSKLPFTIPVGKPETVGADRLALVAAAVYFYPKQHNLIIGLGSCITYNFVNKLHEFLGGAISPGLNMRFKAMNQFTAKLPLETASSNFPLVGYDTKTNLQSGVILGMAKEMDGIIDEYNLRYGNFNVHLTGGDMSFFVPLIKNKIFANPHLIFNGLYALSETNG
ncbi:type III pantothenate kinase [Parafilimonas terrae]|jgi:type III pantothenate kinase|uniref:Type III pantothenate kinase n=1 Tax=Parafilimonas terrae TaxID=1465490 RepID=A0A1I5SD88_9BACT|nr:type III pantothenate kinase [Parafilimonas terrae]SFP68286.1 type III pantothenate kinase [Parafilimonas terrae]